MNLSKIDISIILPCYNEGKWLRPNVIKILRFLKSCRYEFELILIDDHSSDGTVKVARQLAAEHREIKLLTHHQNIGRGGTVSEGFSKARGDIVGFLDVDLEVSEQYIKPMIVAIEAGFDGVIGVRSYNWTFSSKIILRNLFSLLYRNYVRKILALPYKDTEVGYKFFNCRKITPILKKVNSDGWFWDTEIMARSFYGGLNVKEINCNFKRNLDKKSTVRVFNDSVRQLKELSQLKKQLFYGSHLGLIYRNKLIYYFVMKLLYGKDFPKRYQLIAEFVKASSSVVDLCAADGLLYNKYLKPKKIEYLGLDKNPRWVVAARRKNTNVILSDISNESFPKADYLVMQSSLYQFMPTTEKIVKQMFSKAKKGVVISEPVRNIASSQSPISPIIKFVAKILTGSKADRFDEASLESLLKPYVKKLFKKETLVGKREVIYFYRI